MSTAPEIATRAEQPYVAIRARVTMAELGGLGARFGEVFGWLGARGLAPAGAPFFKYNVIDMMRELEVEAGVPVAAAVDGDDHVVSGVLPAGRYATVTHVGHPSELMEVTKALLEWATAQGLTWDVSAADGGERWGSRLEIYLTDPGEEPDMSKWQTQLAFRLAVSPQNAPGDGHRRERLDQGTEEAVQQAAGEVAGQRSGIRRGRGGERCSGQRQPEQAGHRGHPAELAHIDRRRGAGDQRGAEYGGEKPGGQAELGDRRGDPEFDRLRIAAARAGQRGPDILGTVAERGGRAEERVERLPRPAYRSMRAVDLDGEVRAECRQPGRQPGRRRRRRPGRGHTAADSGTCRSSARAGPGTSSRSASGAKISPMADHSSSWAATE